ncbi:hypothetical protein UFOVP199_30 [uncultured Caudovirales phage]|uniref:YqbQ/XkdQ domain-containing protein n=1 Tax=uncultured Caudovirales phage TaxID=2100421 RepID=A0A6J7WIP2_9CAUD|nr:hypothetical protein UFOVP199_30 [uncultured Caudovirales phage]
MAIYDPRVAYNKSTFHYDGALPYDGFSQAPGTGESPWTVELAIDLAANGAGNFFTLDDATKGVLGNTTYKLAGDVLVDITGWVRSIDVKRGRSRVLEKFTAGSCSLVLDNRERLFDPLMTASPFYGSIVPRKQIIVSRDGLPVFTGNVQDWDFSENVSGDATAEPKSSDGFALVAQSNLPAGTATSQLTGARINAVLNQVGWATGLRDIEAGLATLDADVRANDENVLAYMQKVETSENGALFIAKNGKFTFRDSAAPSYSGVKFGDDIPMIDYQVAYGVEELWNKINVTYTSGSVVAGTVTVEDTTSQTEYGVFEVTYDTLLANSTQATTLANALLAEYSQPKYRVDQITVFMEGLTSAQRTKVLSLELADAVLIEWQRFGPAISQYCIIDGVEHSARPNDHRITFKLSETTIA